MMVRMMNKAIHNEQFKENIVIATEYHYQYFDGQEVPWIMGSYSTAYSMQSLLEQLKGEEKRKCKSCGRLLGKHGLIIIESVKRVAMVRGNAL